jgi:hypothetical protein|tara:strand:+ start:257 stop:604 length:348 start_codon:yes stop_codon:yes gene_type:complete
MAIDTDLRKEVNSQGYAIGDIETYGGVPRVTLYSEETVTDEKAQPVKDKSGKIKTRWIPNPNLPGDADSLKKYFRRGMKISPPEELIESDHPLITINPSFIKGATLDKNGNPLVD